MTFISRLIKVILPYKIFFPKDISICVVLEILQIIEKVGLRLVYGTLELSHPFYDQLSVLKRAVYTNFKIFVGRIYIEILIIIFHIKSNQRKILCISI